jgi:hypothetical protein
VCFALGISKRTLQTYREKGIISFSRVGGKYFYNEADVAAYLEAKTKRRTVPGSMPESAPGSQPKKA